MAETFGSVLKEVREKRGRTQEWLAEKLGISRAAVTQWEKPNGTKPTTERLATIGSLLGFDVSAALRGQIVETDPPEVESPKPPRPTTNARRAADEAPIDASRFMGPRDVPIYGTAAGGKRGEFKINRGDVIDRAPRPPGIAHRKGVYALYVKGDSMEPAYEDGARVYADEHRAPRGRDYVIVELHADEGDETEGFIKRLVRVTPNLIVVEQYNPKREIEFDRAEVKHLHRVIPWDELLGV